ncbi:MAG: hypothetical protein WBX01_14425 [Nitrososphaeraceae archaeon]
MSNLHAFLNAEVHAERGGGESDNGCGLTGQSDFATGNGRGVGQGISNNAHDQKDQGSSEGEFVRGGASGCRHN